MSTYSPIASQTLSSAAASVTFSSIPQGYTDLVLVVSAVAGGGSLRVELNADSGANYSRTFLVGDGSSATSGRSSSASLFYFTAGTTNPSATIAHFMNYSNTTTFKTIISRGNDANSATVANVNLWRSTSAINLIKLTAESGNISSGATFSLYGIQVGDKAQKAQGGNIVTSDGTYVYHTFTSSGSFTTNQALTVDYLVVAGGGGGGAGAGGGGAGGMRCTVTNTGGGGSLESALSLSAN